MINFNYMKRIKKSISAALILGIVFHYLVITFLYVLPKYLKNDKIPINENELMWMYINFKSIFIFILIWAVILFGYSFSNLILKSNKKRLIFLIILYIISLFPLGTITFMFHYIGMILYIIFSFIIFSLLYFLGENILFKDKS